MGASSSRSQAAMAFSRRSRDGADSDAPTILSQLIRRTCSVSDALVGAGSTLDRQAPAPHTSKYECVQLCISITITGAWPVRPHPA